MTCEVQQLLENKLGHQPLDSNIKRGTLLDIHYRRPALCRVPGGLPSVVFRALDKDAFAGKENFKAHFEAVN